MDNPEDILLQANNLTEPSVLATIIHIDGSAYRKVGATMLITVSRQTFGILSGGCLEEDLTIRALQLLESDPTHAKVIRYNMAAEDDLGWGRGAGCNGIVTILLEQIKPSLKATFKKITDVLKQGTSVQLTRNITGLNRDSALDEQDVKVAVNMLTINKQLHTTKAQRIKTNRQYLFEQVITPKPRLIIFGAGNDVPFLAQLATETGFNVIIWDWRKAFLHQSIFKACHLIHNPSPTRAWEQLRVKPQDYLLVMTHDFQMDKQIVRLAANLVDPTHYLGILGPTRRTNRLLAGINQNLDLLHSPVGLAIGAEGPKEIAISILAELIACKRNMLKKLSAFVE